MPALVNICANLGFGAALAFVGRRSPSLRDELLSWYLLLLLAFESLVITPVATFLFRFYPQWSLLYGFDPQLFANLDQWIGWLSGLAVVLNYVAALLGYSLMRWGLLREMIAVQLAPGLLAAAGFIGLAVALADRVFYVGDYESFLQGQGTFLFASPAGWLGLLLYAGGMAFLLWMRARVGHAAAES